MWAGRIVQHMLSQSSLDCIDQETSVMAICMGSYVSSVLRSLRKCQARLLSVKNVENDTAGDSSSQNA